MNSNIVFWALENEDGNIEITQALVEELNLFVGQKIAIIYDTEKCYVWNEAKTQDIYTFQDNVEKRGNWNGIDSTNSLSPVELEPKYKVNYEENETVQPLNAVNSIITLATPTVKQSPYDKLCWAACVVSIGNYTTSLTYSIENIAKYVNGSTNFNQGATSSEAMDALQKRCGKTYTVHNNAPSDGTIYENLASDYPIYSRWSYSNGYHATVIRGINKTTEKLYIMDPEYGNTTAQKTNGCYKYTSAYSGVVLTLCAYASYK